MALGLLAKGAHVIFSATGPSDHLSTTLKFAGELARSDRFATIFGDVARYEDCVRMAKEATASFGQIDVLINNAGIPMAGEGPLFWQMNPDDWARMSGTNCNSVFYMCRAVVPDMVARGSGKIINISTSERTMVRPRFSPYGPSKAFVEACSRVWAGELKGTGVSVNVLSPGGAVDTAADVTGVQTQGKTFLPASVMNGPIAWLSSSASDGVSGDRFVANLWREDLPLEDRIVAARQNLP
jgi:3-oxoacyl-[acyl-carrier protein] reductase